MSNLQPIDKMAFDLDHEVTDDVNKFMQDQFEVTNQLKTPILRKENRKFIKDYTTNQQREMTLRQQALSGSNQARKNNQVRIVDNDPVYATPLPRKG